MIILEKKIPRIFFLNPRGFQSLDELLKPGQTGAPKFMEEIIISREKGEAIEDPEVIASSQAEVQKRFEESAKRLIERKGLPTLIFDTCIHSGDSFKPVETAFENAGFSHLRFGVMSEARNESGVIPDFRALPQEATNLCYPFHTDSMIQKTYSQVHSIKSQDIKDQIYAQLLREEITRIMKEQINLHRKGPVVQV